MGASGPCVCVVECYLESMRSYLDSEMHRLLALRGVCMTWVPGKAEEADGDRDGDGGPEAAWKRWIMTCSDMVLWLSCLSLVNNSVASSWQLFGDHQSSHLICESDNGVFHHVSNLGGRVVTSVAFVDRLFLSHVLPSCALFCVSAQAHSSAAP